MRSAIRRRLLWLRNWEGANVLILPALVVTAWGRSDHQGAWTLRVCALVLAVWLLASGATYWHLKLTAIRRGRLRLPRWFRSTFQLLRAVSLAGFAAVAAIAFMQWRSGALDLLDLTWAVGLVAFAALEYANYYHVQLKHDTAADWAYLARHARLRRPPLADDLRRAKARRATGRGGGAIRRVLTTSEEEDGR